MLPGCRFVHVVCRSAWCPRFGYENCGRFRELFLFVPAPCTSYPRRGPPAPHVAVLFVSCLSRAFEEHVRVDEIHGYG